MSRQRLEVAGLRRTTTWSFAARADRERVRWLPARYPASLPGSDGGEPAPPRRPARRPLRRGRIQLVLA